MRRSGVKQGMEVNSAAIYIRVSTQEQARAGVSLDVQSDRLEAYCAMRGLSVVDVIREEGVSGSRALASRPGGAELMALVAGRRVGHVVALKLDRLFRDAEDCLRQTRAWDRAGVALHLLDLGGQAVDTASAMGRMFLTMTAAFAELERNLISERTSSALQHKKGRMEVYGPIPYGYDRQGGALVTSEREQDALVTIGDMHQAGMSLRAIAHELTAQEVPTKRGGRWQANTVRLLLHNDLQLGGAG